MVTVRTFEVLKRGTNRTLRPNQGIGDESEKQKNQIRDKKKNIGKRKRKRRQTQ